MKKILILLVIMLFCVSANAAVDYNNTNLRHKIAQMLIIGFDGTKLTKDSQLYDDLINDRISGVIVFSSDCLKCLKRGYSCTAVSEKKAGGIWFFTICRRLFAF